MKIITICTISKKNRFNIIIKRISQKRTMMKWDFIEIMVEKTRFCKSVINHIESLTSVTHFELLIIQRNIWKYMKFLVRYNLYAVFQHNHRNLRWKKRFYFVINITTVIWTRLVFTFLFFLIIYSCKINNKLFWIKNSEH
jgi:hypothetical protein